MFRKKDTAETNTASEDAGLRRPASDSTAGVGSMSDRPVPKPEASAPPSVSVPASPPQQAEPQHRPSPPASTAERTGNKRLIVGEGIRLSGEISSCDRLVVEGEVEVTLNDTLALEIASSGRFTGGCEVEDADISGIYEGDLTVRNRLFVRGTGRITGTIRYGQLELERGGQISGSVSVLSGDGLGMGGQERKATAPLFGAAAKAAAGGKV
jgi:cytoskeletal protein CcmA (bactofilin family)